MIAMVTCHDLGTDKTLLDSGLGTVIINTKLGAPEVLTITQHLTNLLLAAPGKKMTQTKPNNKTAEGSIQLN